MYWNRRDLYDCWISGKKKQNPQWVPPPEPLSFPPSQEPGHIALLYPSCSPRLSSGSFLSIFKHILVFPSLMLNLRFMPTQVIALPLFSFSKPDPRGSLCSQSTPIHALAHGNVTSFPHSLLKPLCLRGIRNIRSFLLLIALLVLERFFKTMLTE